MNRQPSSSEPVYRFGPFTVDVAKRLLQRGCETLQVPPKVFDLLVALLEQRHRVLSRQDILERVWPRTMVSRAALPQTILKLRRLLNDIQTPAQWLATVRGVGYRFIGPVQVGHETSVGRVTAVGDVRAPERRTVIDDESVHRVNVLDQLALEQAARLDHAGLRHTIATLLDRQLCGADPRARVFALLHQTVFDRHAGQMEKAWLALQNAESLMAIAPDRHCRTGLLRAKGLFFLQFVSYGEAIPWLHDAVESAQRHGPPFMALNCSYLLAACLGRAGDAAGCEEWTQRTDRLARQTEPSWFRWYAMITLAGTFIHLGERCRDRDDIAQARQYWSRALAMLDAAEHGCDVGELGLSASVFAINRAWARGYLHAENRPASIDALRELLGAETLPQLQLSHLLGLATFLCEEGRLAEAESFCDQGLALGESTGIFRHRVGFLSLAADLSERQGRHAESVRRWRALLGWEEKTARADALRIARLTALRLQTEHALATAEAERNLATRLQRENEDIRRDVRRLQERRLSGVGAGLLTVNAFRRLLSHWLDWSRRAGRPLMMIAMSFGLKVESLHGHEGEPASESSELTVSLQAQLRRADQWTFVDQGRILLALADADEDRATLAAARLQRDVARDWSRRRRTASPEVHVHVFDAVVEGDVDGAWQRIMRLGAVRSDPSAA